MTSRPRRHGINAVMLMAERMIYGQADKHLSSQRVEEMKAEAGRRLFVAGNYPGPEWVQFVGFVPAQDLFYQVTMGIAVDPGHAANVLAKALISRDVSNDFCHIVWEPQQRAPLAGRPGT